jgi:hypothetical protein
LAPSVDCRDQVPDLAVPLLWGRFSDRLVAFNAASNTPPKFFEIGVLWKTAGNSQSADIIVGDGHRRNSKTFAPISASPILVSISRETASAAVSNALSGRWLYRAVTEPAR